MHNLPPQPTPFIGRADEVAEIKDVLADPACRLLTLIGPGGIGKTRLALQTAAEILAGSDIDVPLAPVSLSGWAAGQPGRRSNPGFPDGVYFVPLQTTRSIDFLVPAIADAINCPLGGYEDAVVQLLNFLYEKRMLLLLDNFEHLLSSTASDPESEPILDSMGLDGEAIALPSAPESGMDSRVELLSDILAAAPGVKFLVTSREILNLREECLYYVDGLPYPELPPESLSQEERYTPNDSEEDRGWLEEYGAVQLFVERARRVRRDFSLFDEATDVVRICQMVEGMPLAIELAASWTKTMPCSAIAVEIQRNLDFLATSLRNVPDRQRSMRAIFDQSWQLLTQKEQDVFKRLSVLRGSFSRETAEWIAGASLSTLSALVDKSLIRAESRARYHIHELLRQYAALQLAQSPEDIAQVYDRHSTYYADFLRSRQEEMFSPRQREATAEIKAELDNIRAAWDWAVGMLKVEELENAVQTLAWFYQFQSRYQEAANVLEKAVHSLARENTTAAVDRALALVLVELAWFYIRLGRLEQAEAMIAQAGDAYSRLDVPPLSGHATDPVLALGIIASIRGDYAMAAQLGQEARQRSEAQGHQGNLPFAFYLLTRASLAEGDFERARAYARQACTMVERTNDRWFLAYCLNELGNIATALGDYTEAKQHYQTSYAIRESFEDPEGMALALNHLGKIAALEARYEEAEGLYRQSLALYRQINDRGGLATSLNGLGTTACALGNYTVAQGHLRQALQIAMDVQFVPLVLSVLIGFADLLLSTGQQGPGIEMLAFVREHPASERETRNRAQECLDRHKARLEPEFYVAAIEKARNCDLDTVVDAMLQMELIAPDAAASLTRPEADREGHRARQPLVEPLTPRELEVLQLIADGLTNQDIADNLIISVGTVKFYTSQIYGKLNVGSRTQAVARARQLGMLP